MLVRGRRRVGKSRLIEEFVERSGVPYVFFTASKQPLAGELRLFTQEVNSSNLPGAADFAEVVPSTWEGALRLLANAVPPDSPSIVVIDELPYLFADDESFEGTLQKVFDRVVARHPVLFIGVGSDLAMMESLNEYGRPFHQRATEMVVPPLSPAEVADMLGFGPEDAFDAALVTGGLPLICSDWQSGADLWAFLAESLAHSTSALIVSGERSLAAEFPPESLARTVLGVIGEGERTFSNIAQKVGVPAMSLNRALQTLTTKRIVAAEVPLSTKPSKETRYRVADPYLRFWLRFVGTHLPEIERGRSDLVMKRVRDSWSSWRGRAIEPIIRESIWRLPPEHRFGTTGAVGGYWTRTNDPEIDVIVADRAPVATRIEAVGSIKWHDRSAFDARDFSALVEHRAQLPGATRDTPMFAVSRTGSSVSDLTVIGPNLLLEAWR